MMGQLFLRNRHSAVECWGVYWDMRGSGRLGAAGNCSENCSGGQFKDDVVRGLGWEPGGKVPC